MPELPRRGGYAVNKCGAGLQRGLISHRTQPTILEAMVKPCIEINGRRDANQSEVCDSVASPGAQRVKKLYLNNANIL